MRYKVLTKEDIKKLAAEHAGRIVTPYESPEQSKGWVFIVLLSSAQSDTGVTGWIFIGVDHFTRNPDGTVTVEWYPAGVFVPCILKNVVGYYVYGWVD